MSRAREEGPGARRGDGGGIRGLAREADGMQAGDRRLSDGELGRGDKGVRRGAERQRGAVVVVVVVVVVGIAGIGRYRREE